jgi:hypothetical protein
MKLAKAVAVGRPSPQEVCSDHDCKEEQQGEGGRSTPRSRTPENEQYGSRDFQSWQQDGYGTDKRLRQSEIYERFSRPTSIDGFGYTGCAKDRGEYEATGKE